MDLIENEDDSWVDWLIELQGLLEELGQMVADCGVGYDEIGGLCHVRQVGCVVATESDDGEVGSSRVFL